MSRLKYNAVFNWTPDYAEIPSVLWDALRVFTAKDDTRQYLVNTAMYSPAANAFYATDSFCAIAIYLSDAVAMPCWMKRPDGDGNPVFSIPPKDRKVVSTRLHYEAGKYHLTTIDKDGKQTPIIYDDVLNAEARGRYPTMGTDIFLPEDNTEAEQTALAAQLLAKLDKALPRSRWKITARAGAPCSFISSPDDNLLNLKVHVAIMPMRL